MSIPHQLWQRIGELTAGLSRPIALEAELADARKRVRILHYRALERLGVDRHTMCNLWRISCDFGLEVVTEADDGLYHLGGEQTHLILPVHENGELVDLCAFRSAEPTKWLLRTGSGWALGVDAGLEHYTWGDPLALWESPLDWLRSGCDGLCILDWDAPEIRWLGQVPHVRCATSALAKRLRERLLKPVYLPNISIAENCLAA